jgi:hypothetical protein
MYFSPNPSGGPPEAHPFSVTELYTKGKKSHFAQKGELVFVGGPELPPGTEIRKISSHSSRLPEKGGNFPKKKLPLAIHLRLSPNSLEVSLTSPEEIFPAFSQIFPLSPQSAKTRRLFCEIVEPYLAPPGESEYEKSGFSWENTSGLPDDGLYINPKALKALRRELYAALDEHRASSRRKKTEKILTFFTPKTPGVETHAPPPPRGRIHGEDTGLPFVMAPQNVNPSSPEGLEGLYRDTEGRVYLPLAPVLLADAEAYLEEIQTLVRTALVQEESLLIIVGLCNASHFGLTETFAEEKRVSFFLDYGLYCANRAAAAFFRGAFPRLEFFYPWIEGPEALPREAAGLPAADYKDFQPPLFIARASPEKTTENRKTPARAQQGALYRQGKRTFILKKTRAAKTPLDILFPAPP